MPGQQAMYARVAARIRVEIADGTWHLGQTLPGEVQLAERYGVARGTLVRALEVLRDEGLIVTEMGVGSHVSAVPVVATVRVGPDDQAVARLPEPEERDRLRMPPGVPVLVVTRAERPGEPELYDGAVTRISGLE
jgi:DNA-binding transcriptional MocR family regulator